MFCRTTVLEMEGGDWRTARGLETANMVNSVSISPQFGKRNKAVAHSMSSHWQEPHTQAGGARSAAGHIGEAA